MYIHQRALWSVLEWQCAALTCAILKADRKPDWIWPRCTTPVTPTTSSIPSQWLGFENWSSFSGPQGLAPEPQLQKSHVSLTTLTFRNFRGNKGALHQQKSPVFIVYRDALPPLPIHTCLSTLPRPVKSSSHTHTHTHNPFLKDLF